MIKLSVGTSNLNSLAGWQANGSAQIAGYPAHVTRMFPKRSDELLSGGSIYWVIQGQITGRQRIVDLREHTHADGVRRCAILLDPKLIRVTPAPRRPFQGWRYLEAKDAPRDLGPLGAQELPAELDAALAEIGVI